jgi:hypothetical protein
MEGLKVEPTELAVKVKVSAGVSEVGPIIEDTDTAEGLVEHAENSLCEMANELR